MELRRQGYGSRRISRILNISRTTAYQWIKGKNPQGAFSNPPRYHPNLELSETLFYIIGVVLGDGCLYRPRWLIQLVTKERKFAESFRDALKSIDLRVYFYRKRYFRVYTLSKSLFQFLDGLTLKDMEELLTSRREWAISFLRGFYESEGYFERIGRNGRIRIFNTNIDLLVAVKRVMEKLGFHPRLHVYGKDGRLTLPCQETRLFFNVIRPTIKSLNDNN